VTVWRLLACDPGANPGFAEFEDGELVGCGWKPADFIADGAIYDEFVIEAQHAATHIYRNGRRVAVSRRSQQTLSFTAGRLFERFDAVRKFQISANDWRRVLWPGSRSLPKKTVLARLRPEWGDRVAGFPAKHQPDVLEAIGIGLAWLKLSDAAKARFERE